MSRIESGSRYIPPVERVAKSHFRAGEEDTGDHENPPENEPASGRQAKSETGQPKGVLGTPDSFEKAPDDKFEDFLGEK